MLEFPKRTFLWYLHFFLFFCVFARTSQRAGQTTSPITSCKALRLTYKKGTRTLPSEVALPARCTNSEESDSLCQKRPTTPEGLYDIYRHHLSSRSVWGARTADARRIPYVFQHVCRWPCEMRSSYSSMDKPTRALAADKMQGVLRGKQSFLEVQDRCYLWWKRGWRVPCCRDDGFWAKNIRGEVQLVVRSQSMSGGPVSLPETSIALENGWLEY